MLLAALWNTALDLLFGLFLASAVCSMLAVAAIGGLLLHIRYEERRLEKLERERLLQRELIAARDARLDALGAKGDLAA